MSSRSLVLLVACGLWSLAGTLAAGENPPQAAPPKVTVCQPLVREVTDYADFPGRTQAAQRVDIRSRVTGYLVKVAFQPGALVKRGELLFEIDPRPYQADLDKAQAEVHLAETRLKYRALQLNRANAQRANNAIPMEDLDRIVSEQQEAQAMVAVARAGLDAARLNLEFTRVTAPIAGRIGQPALTAGNLVKADDTLLATIVATDPLYADFQVDERTLLHLRRRAHAGQLKAQEASELSVGMGLVDEKGFPHRGKIAFVNNQVDATTGTLRVRAVFPTTDPVLVPGLFVRIRLTTSGPYKALLVPEQAVGSDRGKKYLFVLTDRNVAEQRPVTLGVAQDDWRVIQGGLKAGDWVIVQGLEEVKPGRVVKPQRLAPPPPEKP
jgi:RND family efflux transporter MFP subunit